MFDRYSNTAVDLDASPDEAARDLHAQALADYDAAWLREQDNQREGLEDLRLFAGEQWDEALKASRDEAGRPCMTENRLPQFVRQITGDLRQMRPALKAVATNSQGDAETADVIKGMIRYIETRSQARAVYFRAADSMVVAGRGAFRIETEYSGNSTLEQEIRISPIEDGLSVLFDPDALLPDRSDGRFCFVPVDLSRPAFKKRFPQASGQDFGDQSARAFTGWYGEDFVRVAEYWWKEEIERTLLLVGGQVKDLTDDPDGLAELDNLLALAAEAGRQDIRVEKRPGFRVRRVMVSGSEVLDEPIDWPGNYIPIVAMDGEEVRIGRQILRHGAVRHARDPQRLLNYMVSAYAEAVALQPKAPYLGTEKNFEQYEDEWARANSDNLPFLRYTPDDANGRQAPQRVNPAVASQGFVEGINMASGALQATTGIYNASLGAASNETSGRAITARQREGDTGTYVYVEHFEQALQAAGKIIIDLIPHIYDTTRSMRIIGEDGGEELVEINKPVGLSVEDQQVGRALQRYENDVTVKAYDIVVEMGPSYNTRREEARDGLLAFIQASPQLAPLLMDLVAKMQDWPLSDEVRERLELMLPPPIRAQIAEKRGEPLPEPAGPSPEQEAAMADRQRQQQQDDRKHAIDVGKLQLGAQKLQTEQQRTGVDLIKTAADAHTRRHEANVGAAAAQASAPAPGLAPASAPAEDPRVALLAAQVAQLQSVVMQLVQAVQTGNLPVPDAPPDGGGGPVPGPSPVPQIPQPQPASAGFSMPGTP